MLLEIAKHWRTLGEQAKVKETNAGQATRCRASKFNGNA